MDGVEEEFGDRIAVVRLNVEQVENARVQQQYGVRGHPSAVILDRDNQIVERFFGPVSVEILRDALQTVVP